MNPPDPDLITTREAADILSVSVSTLNRWQTSGLITAVHSGEGPRGSHTYRRAVVVAMALKHIEAAEDEAGDLAAGIGA